jgi:hypothetical protein
MTTRSDLFDAFREDHAVPDPAPRPDASPGDCQSARPTLPVVEHLPVRLDAAERRRLRRIAGRLLFHEPTLSGTDAFGPRVTTGLSDGPGLMLEDHREIALFSLRDTPLSYRALLLAGEGDVVVVDCRRDPDFEAYCREVLGLGRVEVLYPPMTAPPLPLAVRCARDPQVLARIADVARRHGRLAVVPYMGTGGVWALACTIAERSGAEVTVAAPPPRLTRRVNDKLWFARRVINVLGPRALPQSYSTFGPAALAGRVAVLARRYERVVIKVPSSSGSLGNIVLESADVSGRPAAALRRSLLGLLAAAGWRDSYPLMVGVWDCSVIESPSVQLWVPHRAQGLPIVEGIFTQVVTGSAGEFVGAVASELSARWQTRLAEEAVRLAVLLQELGYFGRCSLDAVLVGEDTATAELHWIECNGRWGGVSIPMTLANRLVGDWRRRAFAVVQRTDLNAAKRPFSAALARIETHLYRPGQRETGVVVVSPGGMVEGTGVNLLVLGADPLSARREAQAVAQAVLGPAAA